VTQHQVSQLVSALNAIASHTSPEPYRPFTDWGMFVATCAVFIATVGLFWATYRVAKRTADLADDTLNAAVLSDIHHQESQSGYVVWNGDRKLVFTPSGSLKIYGYIANMGPGAAGMITFAMHCESTGTILPFLIVSLASGGEFYLAEAETTSLAEPIRMVRTFPVLAGPLLAEFLDGQMISIIITYRTIYNRERSTKYLLNTRASDDKGVNLTFWQEIINLNRDPRAEVLSERIPNPRVSWLAKMLSVVKRRSQETRTHDR
jgi:hypothetical protein